ncbi:hypothetical protein [Geomicrobium sediminis]|uniref:DUF3961 domain-containing protein n=1 Tax=Geomicrobium sediminis TaxID=1347788 RepID=A0ABS2P703_9BACL|nr:hypothetical protein [Geomicrobium sediminis]MBM7631170.1 hypothetical protein [Geomicrobium sediminis]
MDIMIKQWKLKIDRYFDLEEDRYGQAWMYGLVSVGVLFLLFVTVMIVMA